MLKKTFNNPKLLLCLQAFFMYTWLANLINTDSFLTVYILCAILGALCMRDNLHHSTAHIPCWVRILASVLSILFASATVIANYPLFSPVTALLNLMNIIFSLLGGSFIGYHVLLCAIRRFPSTGASAASGKHPIPVFFVSFLTIAVVFLLYMLTTGYPVYLAHDSIVSMNQLAEGVFTNHHPYWYTQFIGFCLNIGALFSSDPNIHTAAYSTIQILILAACFAYSLVTLYQAKIPWFCLIFTLGLYCLLPYHITYSITMWKDTLFGASTLAALSALYRIIKEIGQKKWLNYVLFGLSSIGFCLIRNNGIPVYFVWIAFLVIFLGKKHWKLHAICVAVLIFCLIITGPLLTALGVADTEIIEVLAIPIQQVARVVSQDLYIPDAERIVLEKIFYLDKVKELYTPYIVDPVKFDALCSGGMRYLSENLGEFIKTWISLGLKYPGTYLEAWVEETKGFWNGGYYYWIYFRGTYPEITGIGGFEMNNIGKTLFDALFRYTETPIITQPFYSIGLHVWIIFGCCFVCFAQGRKEFLISIPLLVLSAVLWVMTPVYAEFRYAYPMFTTCPMIILTTLFSQTTRPSLIKDNSDQSNF